MTGDVSFACPDWEAKLRRGETPIARLPLNEARATRAVRMFDDLRLPDVRGFPRLAEASGEWFRDIVRNAFAAEHPETGLPLVNEVFCLVPKKNAKTTYGAALGLTALLLNDAPNAQMLILGPTQNVAQRCFDQAHGMIRADPQLRRIFHVQEHLKTITRIKTGAVLAVKTFDLNVVTGEIPALTIIDELHVVAGRSFAERVIKQITGGMVTNAGALLVYITTQSDVPPRGVFKTKLDYARGVRDGTITEGVRMLPVLYEFPAAIQAGDDKPWRDPALWPMVLPNLGRSVLPELLRDQYETSRQEGIESETLWASQHLNIEIGLGLHGDRWVGADFWLRAAKPELTLDRIIETSEVFTVGIDGGGMDDLMALALIGRHRETRALQAWVHAWADPVVLERRKGIAADLRQFEAAGDLTIGDPDAHVDAIVARCADLKARGLMPAKHGVGLDAFGVAVLIDRLGQAGFEGEQLLSVGQGWKLQAAVQTLPRLLKSGALVHCGQPLMAWCVRNAKATVKGSNTVITKEAAGVAKIDPLVALFNAYMLMTLNPEGLGQSYLETGPMLVL